MISTNAPSAYVPNRSLPAKLARRMTQWRVAKPLPAAPRRAIVSFTFDDFPVSAATTGADIIEAAGGKATYYACTGMAGTRNETGDLFTAADIVRLAAKGHEIAGHTISHLDCAKAFKGKVMADVNANLAALKQMGHAAPVTQFAYPFGETHIGVKQALVPHFRAARGVLAGVNTKGSDLMQLRALELDANDWTTGRAAKAIEAAAKTPAWVVIFTHDVRSDHSTYGTTPEALTRLTTLARDTGAALLTMSAALDEIEAGA